MITLSHDQLNLLDDRRVCVVQLATYYIGNVLIVASYPRDTYVCRMVHPSVKDFSLNSPFILVVLRRPYVTGVMGVNAIQDNHSITVLWVTELKRCALLALVTGEVPLSWMQFY